jgi:uncharacterized protein (TIGR00251 family)
MRITVDVKAGSNRDSVEEINENHLMVHVRAPPTKGKANAAIIKLLRKHYDRRVTLVSGFTSNTKIFEVDD